MNAMTTAYRPFKTLLVANRGEIACRIIRTARRMGLATVAVHSDADRAAPHARLADRALRIGAAPAADSYLRVAAIIEAAQESGAEAIHPGYGFLSERAEFAEAVEAAGLVFVGPRPGSIRAMGLKDAAKALVDRAGVPIVPGYHGERQEPAFLKEQAYRIGYPVLIKAVAGGGGKGMRRVDKHADFDAALASARREAEAAFGEPRVLIEKYVASPRHVEVQVFGDSHGRIVHLFERDCSCQRRHQKVIEEAPAPGMSEEVRAAMGEAAVEAARAVGYVGAGTVEFIADGSRALRPDGFFFMEMNTRLQVEHPVTEAVTGLDLVEWQLRVAAGEPLPLPAAGPSLHGHAIEARLYAEDPEQGFLPSTGRLFRLRLPAGEGIRVDSGVEEGGTVTPFYDPMIAKVIAHGATREEAAERLSAALGETLVAGPRTNLAFLKALVDLPEFRAGTLDTGLIERNLAALGAEPRPPDMAAVIAGARALLAPAPRANAGWPSDPWALADGFQLAGPVATRLPVLADGATVHLEIRFARDGTMHLRPADGAPELPHAAERPLTLVPAGAEILVLGGGRQTRVALETAAGFDGDQPEGGAVIASPMHGRVVMLDAVEGARVEKGAVLAVVEAMKMEHALLAPRSGTIASVLVRKGEQVQQGARLIVLSEALTEAS